MAKLSSDTQAADAWKICRIDAGLYERTIAGIDGTLDFIPKHAEQPSAEMKRQISCLKHWQNLTKNHSGFNLLAPR